MAHLLPDRKDPGCVLRWPDVPTMPTIVWGATGFGSRTPPLHSLYGRCYRNRPGTWSSNSRVCRRHPDLHQLRRIGSSTRCHTSVGLRIGNRILDELNSAETECLEYRIHLDWHSAATLQGRGRSPDGMWAISNADGKSTGSRCLRRQGADNGGSRELYVVACINSANFAASSGR